MLGSPELTAIRKLGLGRWFVRLGGRSCVASGFQYQKHAKPETLNWLGASGFEAIHLSSGGGVGGYVYW